MVNNVKEMATLQADVANIKETVTGLKGYLERSATERTIQYTESVRTTAVLQTDVTAIKTGMQEWESTVKTHEGRITTVENTIANAIGRCIGFAAAISVAMGAITLLITWLHK